MSMQEVEKFYIRVEEDEHLQHILKEIDKNENGKLNKISNMFLFIKDKIIPIAKGLGYNFTTEELLFYETKILKLKYKRVIENDVDNITGGTSNDKTFNGLSSIMNCFSMNSHKLNDPLDKTKKRKIK